MKIMIKLENVTTSDQKKVEAVLGLLDDISFNTIEEEGFDGVSVLMIILSSGTIAAIIKAVEKVYSTKIKSINEKKYSVKITKDGIEVNAPTLNETRKLLKDASYYVDLEKKLH